MKSQQGSILLQFLIAAALMLTVGLAGAHLSASTKTTELMGDVSNTVNQSHLLVVQQSHNVTATIAALQGTTSPLDLSAGSNVSRCLRGMPPAGFNCTSLNQTIFTPIDVWTHVLHLGPGRDISNNASYRLVCTTPQLCETIQLRLESHNSAGDIRRTSDLRLNGIALSEPEEISFSCAGASGQIVTGINYVSRESICDGIPVSTNNCANRPITDIAANSDPQCATLAALNCPNGIKQIGLLGSQGTCL